MNSLVISLVNSNNTNSRQGWAAKTRNSSTVASFLLRQPWSEPNRTSGYSNSKWIPVKRKNSSLIRQTHNYSYFFLLFFALLQLQTPLIRISGDSTAILGPSIKPLLCFGPSHHRFLPRALYGPFTCSLTTTDVSIIDLASSVGPAVTQQWRLCDWSLTEPVIMDTSLVSTSPSKVKTFLTREILVAVLYCVMYLATRRRI